MRQELLRLRKSRLLVDLVHGQTKIADLAESKLLRLLAVNMVRETGTGNARVFARRQK